MRYRTGRGVEKDDAKAIEWLKKAAAHETSASVLAQYDLGSLYLKGEGVAQDDKQAAEWLEKAAGHDYIHAQKKLAALVITGTGTPQDTAKGMELLRAAAEQGDATSQTLLGMAYNTGLFGIGQDPAQARVWLEKAAAQGSKEARAYLERVRDGQKTGE